MNEVQKELEIRRTPGSVRPGDIIVTQLRPNDPGHVAIVYDVKNNHVIYMDMNGRYNGWGMYSHKWGARNIYAIYSVSFSLWCGDIMQKINKGNER